MNQLQNILTFIFDAEFRTIIIVLIFTLVMLYFAYLDYKSFTEGKHTDYKSLIVSTGVLGTFLGIFLGLQEFDSENIKNSVPTLLEGLKLAFATSIAGMGISVILSAFQKGKSLDADDDLGFLKSINSKLDKLDSLKSIDDTSKEFIVQLKNFRMELRDEQLKLRNFIEQNFTETNESLERAIEALSRGATEEIIKALNKVITDFNDNLKEQFGENFKQLNEAVFRLIEWQKNYRGQVEDNKKFLSEIRDSLNDSQVTIGEVANKNQETLIVYQNLGKIIETYDTQVKSVNEQLKTYSEIGDKAKLAFTELDNGFRKINDEISKLTNNIQTTVTAQSESMSKQSESLKEFTQNITKQVPDSLGQLENALVSLTEKFKEDYNSFLEKYNDLIAR